MSDNYSEKNFELLARLDERTKAIQSDILTIRLDLKEKTLKLEEMIDSSKDEYESVIDSLEKNYVRKETFSPVQRLVYGVVGLILSGVVVALLGLFVVK